MNFINNTSTFKKIILKVANPVLNSILSIKNIHAGESCYIFGDGISIKWFDLSVFSNKPSISLNKIGFHKQSNFLNLKYSLFLEPFYFYPYFWDKDKATVKITGKKFFKNNVQIKFRELIKDQKETTFFTNISNYPVLWNSNIYYLFQIINDPESPFLQECYSKNENIFKGSMRSAIALAIFMGFKEIFLIGCDYTHEKTRSHHWYEKGQGKIIRNPKYQERFFNIASKYAKLTTITLDGKGSILPAKTYYEFSGKEPKFRENYELMKSSMLKTLSEDPWYKDTIF